MKDFLFITYDGTKEPNELFKFFETKGHSIDFVTEKNVRDFHTDHKYKNVVLYLHENHTIPYTNTIIDKYCKDSFFIQHDNTDHEDIQIWSNRKPDLIMQRELTKDSKLNWGNDIPIIPFHFNIHSIYDESLQDKQLDFSFIGNITSHRRAFFAEKLKELCETTLSELKFFVKFTGGGISEPDLFKNTINRSKVCIHYYGNSYDSIRIWELASAKVGIVMPKMRNLSVTKDYMPFSDYETIKDDCSDLPDKIFYLLENDRYKKLAEKSFNDYNENHTPQKCCEYYYEQVMKYGRK